MIIRRKKLAVFIASMFSVSMSIGQESAATETSDIKSKASPSDSILEDVLVTARRIEESRQEVPMSISVLDSEALDLWNIRNTDDLAQSIPGLTGSKQDSGNTIYAIRGQTQVFAGSISLPSVVDYFAEVPEFSAYLYDLQSVQVLKGPQGTLFGRNTTGGAILFTPARPTEEFSGYVTGRIGNFNNRELEFGVGGSLLDNKLLVRLSGQQLKADGYTDNLLTGRDIDNTNRQSYRLSLVFQHSEQFENYTIFQYEDRDERFGSMVLHAFDDSPFTPYVEGYRNFLPIQEARGPYKVELDSDPEVKDSSKGVINTTTWDVNDSWSLKNIVSYRRAEEPAVTARDSDGSPFLQAYTNRDTDSEELRVWTEEFQVHYQNESFRAIAGVYYEDRDQPLYDTTITQTALPGSTVDIPVVLTSQIIIAEASRSEAIFLNTSIDDFLVDGLNIAAGVRYTDDRRENTLGSSLVLGNGIFVPLFGPFEQELNSDAISWNLSADYPISPDLLGYATVRRGYKGGGFNLPISTPDTWTYDPEYVTSVEAGLKFQKGFDNWAVLFNAAVFYDEYTDIQREIIELTATPSIITSNAADADIMGADFEFVLARSNFTLSANYSWLKAEYKEFVDSGFGDLSGSEFINSPEHQLSITPAFTLPVSEDWGTLTLSMPFFWQSETYYSTPNTPNGTPTNDTAVLGAEPGDSFYNLGLNVAWADIVGSRFNANLYVRNLTDETYTTGGFNSFGTAAGGISTRMYAPPRTYGLELRYEF